MPGKQISNKQVELYMKSRKNGYTQVISAAKADISERSGRDIEKGKRRQRKMPREYRRKEDPLKGAFDEIVRPLLEEKPALTPITLLEILQERNLNDFPDSILRTLQRRVKEWKLMHGPKKEVMFRQEHEPGRQGFSDFTHMDEAVTIEGEKLSHQLYHFRLGFSGWSYMKVILGGESYTALAEGLQEALWKLGGSPKEHRTDSLSAAFKNLSQDEQKDITERYDNLCSAYQMKATRNNRGKSHENGSIESPHGHLKRRIHQALILRGNAEFSSVEEYQQFIEGIVRTHNNRNAKQTEIEKENLRPLPQYRTVDYTEVLATVSTSSTIQIHRGVYTVPSQLIGETLRVHLYHDRLCCYAGSKLIVTLKRLYGKERKKAVDYRHIIHSLVKKPQAFRYSRIRNELLPNDDYRFIWSHVDQTMPPKESCRFIVGLLKIAAQYDCEKEVAQKVIKNIKEEKSLNLCEIEMRYKTPEKCHIEPEVDQHKLLSYDNLLGGCA